MRSEKKIKKYSKGMRLKADDVNQIVRRLEKVENLATIYPLRLDETSNSLVLSLHDYIDVFPFVLAADLTPGGAALAHVYEYIDFDQGFIEKTTTEIYVLDLYTKYRGKIGYKGICASLSGGTQNKSHIIIDIEQKAEIILFQLSDSLLRTEEYKEDCIVLKYFRGKDPSVGTDKITVWNPPAASNGPFGYSTASSFVSSSSSSYGKIGWATYDPIEDKYWIIDLEC